MTIIVLKTLDHEAKKILKTYGMLPNFAKSAMYFSEESGQSVIYRAAKNSSRITTKLCAQKTGMTKSKSGNWGSILGYIPCPIVSLLQYFKDDAEALKRIGIDNIDQFSTQVFSKMDPNTLEQVGIDADDKKKVPEYAKNGLLTVVAVKESLAVILEASKQERYKNLKITQDPKTKEQILSFNYSNCPKDITKKITINIDVAEVNSIMELQQAFQIGNNKDFFAKERVVLYDGKQIPVMANKDKVPFTGDWDLLAVGHPHSLKEEYSQVINTFKDSTVSIHKLLTLSSGLFKELSCQDGALEIYTALKKQMQESNLTFNKLISKFSLSRAGCITPYEFMQTTIRNYLRHGNRAVENPTLNEIQHGPENRNPGKASDIDAPMIIFFNGEVIITENSQELHDFMLQNNAAYLKQNRLDINKRWDKKYWGPIITKQDQIKRIKQAALKGAKLKKTNSTTSIMFSNKKISKNNIETPSGNNTNNGKNMLGSKNISGNL